MIEDISDNLPEGAEEAIEQIAIGIRQFISALYPDMDWMVDVWSCPIEAVGYNREGRKFRVIENAHPIGQSISGTIGVASVAGEGFLNGIDEYRSEED